MFCLELKPKVPCFVVVAAFFYAKNGEPKNVTFCVRSQLTNNWHVEKMKKMSLLTRMI